MLTSSPIEQRREAVSTDSPEQSKMPELSPFTDTSVKLSGESYLTAYGSWPVHTGMFLLLANAEVGTEAGPALHVPLSI